MFEERLTESGLNVLDNWKGDIRPQLEKMLEVLIEGTPYSFRVNTTDTSAKILELHRLDHDGRIAGFSGKQDGTITAFFNQSFYNEVNQRFPLPENMWTSKSQAHVKLTIAGFWNVLCVATGKIQYLAKDFPPSESKPHDLNEAIALAVSSTYDLVVETGVTAHPARSPYPKKEYRFVIPIEKGGGIKWVFSVAKTIECLSDDIELNLEGLSAQERERLLSYHTKRLGSFGYANPGDPYRFYLMEKAAEIVSPEMKKGIQVSARMNLSEMDCRWLDSEAGCLDLESVIHGETEGAQVAYYTTKYERSSKNRADAIAIHGAKCQACGFDFEEAYGDLGKGFIEVHHAKPLFSLEEETVINPAEDLVCLCSNCHRMVHRAKGSVLSLEELKARIGTKGSNWAIGVRQGSGMTSPTNSAS